MWYFEMNIVVFCRLYESNLSPFSFSPLYICFFLPTRDTTIRMTLLSIIIAKTRFMFSWLVKLQVSCASWLDSWAICLCHSQKNQIECRKGNIHIYWQCATANRCFFTTNIWFLEAAITIWRAILSFPMKWADCVWFSQGQSCLQSTMRRRTMTASSMLPTVEKTHSGSWANCSFDIHSFSSYISPVYRIDTSPSC